MEKKSPSEGDFVGRLRAASDQNMRAGSRSTLPQAGESYGAQQPFATLETAGAAEEAPRRLKAERSRES